ncbi:hypothetical protein D1641_15515 [Colidextribacter sp. OB.20]|uniref:hypothetical protein n=1 Tax=Colidextribacter sp. OB.20 TaxID=2304568 RepID=UPI00136CC96E|nr:hypothetical protein [Colidextribacter sp. OB.20]NBI11402.1 hypothetical protein [Colidextribacter sp. OB.20]
MGNDSTRRDRIQPLHMVDAKVTWEIGEDLINAVISAAVWSTERKPGTWQKMIEAVNRGAAGTKEGTVNAFFFRAMVSRLLEEFDALNT